MGSIFSKPKAPDPVATANAQNQINQNAIRDTAGVNQINEVTPFGTRTYTGTIGSNDRTVTDTLSPELQGILNSQIRTTGGLSDIAEGRVGGIPRGDFTLDGMPAAGRATLLEGYATPAAFGDVGQAQSSIAAAGDITKSFRDVGQQQRNVDISGIPQIAGINDFSAERNRVEDALFQRGSRRVNEQYDRDLSGLQSQLAAQGITQGSQAYDREMTRLMQNRDDALRAATEGSIINAGGEQGRLFGQSLAARQQGVGEQFSLADLFNQAQSTDYNQAIGRAQFENAAQAQQFGQNEAQARLFNEALAQNFGQDFARVNADRDWNMRNAEFINENRLAQFDLDNAARENAINENVLSRNQNLNEIAALISGSPVSPQGQLNFQTRAQYNPAQASPDAMGLASSNYNAQQQSRAALLGSIFGAAGTLGGGYLGRG